MRISAERLAAEANSTRFPPALLEKVAQLLSLLNALREQPSLRNRFVLKGGTALNLFTFAVPRLSVDIDVNYVGAEGRNDMLTDRPAIEKALQSVVSREGFGVATMPHEHAGGKWRLTYTSVLGGNGTLEVDLNYMFRIPLWPVSVLDSHPVGAWRATGIPVLDIHELAAGKLAALLSRRLARDLFDSHRLLESGLLERERLRLAFVVYGAMNRKDWRTVTIDDVDFDAVELAGHLLPTLNVRERADDVSPATYGDRLVNQTREGRSAFRPGCPQVEMHDVVTPMTWVRYTANWKASYEGWMMSMDTFGMRMSKTLPGLENFYMVGQWVEPGGGPPPSACSGRNLAQILCKRDGKRFVTMRA